VEPGDSCHLRGGANEDAINANEGTRNANEGTDNANRGTRNAKNADLEAGAELEARHARLDAVVARESPQQRVERIVPQPQVADQPAMRIRSDRQPIEERAIEPSKSATLHDSAHVS
jgi:hypothetical protein